MAEKNITEPNQPPNLKFDGFVKEPENPMQVKSNDLVVNDVIQAEKIQALICSDWSRIEALTPRPNNWNQLDDMFYQVTETLTENRSELDQTQRQRLNRYLDWAFTERSGKRITDDDFQPTPQTPDFETLLELRRVWRLLHLPAKK